MLKIPEKFTITRSKWHRGSITNSYLLQPDSVGDKMCCVGFFSLACGATPEEILGRKVLQSVDRGGRDIAEDLSVSYLYDKNDVPMDERDREHYITEHFAKFNITVTFED